MDHGQFDAFTRAWSADASRRQALRALLGGALGGVATKLGLGEDAEAKGKKQEKGHKDRKRSGQVQAAGKKHKKHKNDHKDKNKDKDKPRQCSPGFRRCISGEGCIADKPFICCIDETICAGGRCVRGACCPTGQKYCGSDCIPENECCDLEAPLCTGCEEAVCENGEWECRSTCPSNEVCCSGECMGPCSNGCERYGGCSGCSKPPQGNVFCWGQKRCVPECPAGQELDSETCQCKPLVCPNGSPDYCSGGDWSRYKCGEPEFNCFCMKSTTGDTHCSSRTSDPYSTCLVDADCEQMYPGRETFCHHCSNTCYFVAECAATSP